MKKTPVALIVALIAAAGISEQAHAGGTAVGPIKTYWTGTSGSTELLLVYFTSVSNSPSCAGGSSTRFIYASSQPNYKSVLATVMAAYFSGGSVLAEGAGTCNTWSNTEDLSYICPGVGVGGC